MTEYPFIKVLNVTTMLDKAFWSKKAYITVVKSVTVICFLNACC